MPSYTSCPVSREPKLPVYISVLGVRYASDPLSVVYFMYALLLSDPRSRLLSVSGELSMRR